MAKNTVESWDTTASNNTDIGGINLAEGWAAAGANNAFREGMKQFATWLATLFATAADFIAGTSSTKALTPDAITDLTTPTTVAYGATITLDMDTLTSLNLKTTLTGNLTLANISNKKIGKVIRYRLTQDGTGGRTITWGSDYVAAGGLPSLSSTAGAKDCFYLTIESSTEVSVDYGRSYST